MADNFHVYYEVVETISQSHLGEGESSDVTDRRRHVESCDHLLVFTTSVEKFLCW